MNDGNYIYITLTKIKRLNKYNEIKEEMNGKKGIIYLDSGNYVEVKDWYQSFLMLSFSWHKL